MKISILFFVLAFTGIFAKNTAAQDDIVKETTNSSAIRNLYVGLDGIMGVSYFTNDFVSNNSLWSSKSGISFSPNVNILYMITPNIGFGTGVGYGYSKTGFSVNDFSLQLSKEFVDLDGDIYFPIYEEMTLDEMNILKSIDVPVFVTYKSSIGNFNYYVNAGLKLSFFQNISYTLDGEFSRKGFYPEYEVTLYNIPQYGYMDYKYEPNKTHEIGAPSYNIAGMFAFGLITDFSSGLSLKTGITANYSIKGIAADFDKNFTGYHSSTVINDSFLHSFGIEFGVFYNLEKFFR